MSGFATSSTESGSSPAELASASSWSGSLHAIEPGAAGGAGGIKGPISANITPLSQSSGGPHTSTAITPPGLATWLICFSTAAGSAENCNELNAVTTSKEPGSNGNASSMSPTASSA